MARERKYLNLITKKSNEESFDDIRKVLKLPVRLVCGDSYKVPLAPGGSNVSKNETSREDVQPPCPSSFMYEDPQRGEGNLSDTVEPVFDFEEFHALAEIITITTVDDLSFNSDELTICAPSVMVSLSSKSYKPLKRETKLYPNAGTSADFQLIEDLRKSLRQLKYKKPSNHLQEPQEFSNLEKRSTLDARLIGPTKEEVFPSDNRNEEELNGGLPKGQNSESIIKYISPKVDRLGTAKKGWKQTKCYRPQRSLGKVRSNSHEKKVRIGSTPRYKSLRMPTISRCLLMKHLKRLISAPCHPTHSYTASKQDVKPILKYRTNKTLLEEKELLKKAPKNEDDRLYYNLIVAHDRKIINKKVGFVEGEALRLKFLGNPPRSEYNELLRARQERILFFQSVQESC